ncbi:IS21-like element helper ATPase IstB [Mycoplasmatota bacterium zrk1]
MNIEKYAMELKLPYIRHNFETLIKEAIHTKMEPAEFLENVLEHEHDHRLSNRIKNRFRYAKFPHKKHLDEFQTDKYNSELQSKFTALKSLEFIDKKENIILIGNPGSGKTHLAIALGVKACLENRRVLFISVPNLIIELKEAMSSNQLQRYKRKFENFDLVILDELGYVSFDKSGCEILFNLLSNRNDKGSIIITTNLNFDRWEEIFKDPMLTGALIDRITHKAHVLDMTVETSYRFEETVNWMKLSK